MRPRGRPRRAGRDLRQLRVAAVPAATGRPGHRRHEAGVRRQAPDRTPGPGRTGRAGPRSGPRRRPRRPAPRYHFLGNRYRRRRSHGGDRAPGRCRITPGTRGRRRVMGQPAADAGRRRPSATGPAGGRDRRAQRRPHRPTAARPDPSDQRRGTAGDLPPSRLAGAGGRRDGARRPAARPSAATVRREQPPRGCRTRRPGREGAPTAPVPADDRRSRPPDRRRHPAVPPALRGRRRARHRGHADPAPDARGRSGHDTGDLHGHRPHACGRGRRGRSARAVFRAGAARPHGSAARRPRRARPGADRRAPRRGPAPGHLGASTRPDTPPGEHCGGGPGRPGLRDRPGRPLRTQSGGASASSASWWNCSGRSCPARGGSGSAS